MVDGWKKCLVLTIKIRVPRQLVQILLSTVSVYQYKTDTKSRGCYGIGHYNDRVVVQLSNCVCNMYSERKLLQLRRSITDNRNWEGKQSSHFSLSPLNLSVSNTTIRVTFPKRVGSNVHLRTFYYLPRALTFTWCVFVGFVIHNSLVPTTTLNHNMQATKILNDESSCSQCNLTVTLYCGECASTLDE